MDKKELVAQATTDLITRYSGELDFIFRPRYTNFSDSKQVQTNPYATFDDEQKSAVVFESLTMVLGQMIAFSIIEAPDIEQQHIYNTIFNKIKKHGEAYHQMILQMKEEKNENRSKGSEGGDAT